MDGLELLRSRNRFEQDLPSGLKVTLRLPRLRDCILAGDVPTPVLQKVIEASTSDNGGQEVVSTEIGRQMAAFHDEIVRRSIVAVEGESVEMTADAVSDLTQADYDFIVAFATRSEESPLASGP